jgi:hypothetical protein
MPGPEETRLIQALTGSKHGKVGDGAKEWAACAQTLRRVATRLATTSMTIPHGEAGAQTVQAMNSA